MMAAKGAAAEDIARLERATFYFATEGTPRPFKIRTALFPSFYPANPFGNDKIAERARTVRAA